MSDVVLEVRNLRRNYGKVRAVDDLSFAVGRGRVVGFIGPNGAGKTTTMRIAATLDLPDAGDVFVDGLSVLVEPRKVRQRVGFMSDQFAPYPNLDVMQYLDFFARANGLTGRERLRSVRSVASFCGLETFATRPATGLSKGMGQRLHLAKTMLHDPALLILDEPASGLDPRARIEFRELIGALAANGKSILISSHILVELSESCDDVIVLEKGRLVAGGSIAEVARGVQRERVLEVRLHDGADLPSDTVIDAARRFFVVQPHVDAVDVGEGGRLSFGYAGSEDEVVALLRRAIEAGLPIAEFAQTKADLEDIFMRMTKGRLQ